MVPVKEKEWKRYKKKYLFRSKVADRVNRRIIRPVFGCSLHGFLYGGKLLHARNWANARISAMIKGDVPFMVSRFGNTELNLMNHYFESAAFGESEENRRGLEEWWENLYKLCGFFPKDESFQKPFSELFFSSALETDLLGTWYRPMEDYYLRYYMKDTEITQLGYLEPWKTDRPWTRALEGKKVLVIHPFEESIRKQYARRQLIFPDGLLPEFELDVLKAVQTLGDSEDSRFATWFDALDYMYEEAVKRDFEVAIVGCGAYGMPLAARLKKAGKKVIHLGGATQCLFGIKGKRWLSIPEIPINEHWVFPDAGEVPSGAEKVENGCYWG